MGPRCRLGGGASDLRPGGRRRGAPHAGGAGSARADARAAHRGHDLRRRSRADLATFVVGGRVHVADLVGGRRSAAGGVRRGCVRRAARPDRPPPGVRRRRRPPRAGPRRTAARTGVLAHDDDPDIHWGVAEFVASEELDRHRGYWWSPDGERIVAARVDERPVRTWYISSPVDPDSPPRAVRYPQAGTDNADVSLSVLGLDGSRVDIDWDREAFPYLINVTWNDRCPLTLLVLSRDQKRWLVLEADPGSGKTQTIFEDTAEHWQTVVTGVPDRLSDGRLVFVDESEDTRRITLDGEPATPPGLQVSTVLDVGDDVLFAAQEDPTELHVWRGAGGEVGDAPERLTTEPGMHLAARAADVTVIVSELLDPSLRRVRVLRAGEPVAEIRSLAESPVIGCAADVRGRRRPRHPCRDVHPGGCGTRRPSPRDHGSVRRSPLRPRDQVVSVAPRTAVARRSGVRRSRRGRSWHAGTRRRMGARRLPRSRPPRAGGPGRRASRGCRSLRIPGPEQGRDPRMVLRRFPRGVGGPSPAGRLPRRGGRARRTRNRSSTTRPTPSDTSGSLRRSRRCIGGTR